MVNFSLCWCQQEWLWYSAPLWDFHKSEVCSKLLRFLLSSLASPSGVEIHLGICTTVTPTVHTASEDRISHFSSGNSYRWEIPATTFWLCPHRLAGVSLQQPQGKPQHLFKQGASNIYFWRCRDLKSLFWNSLWETMLCVRGLQSWLLAPVPPALSAVWWPVLAQLWRWAAWAFSRLVGIVKMRSFGQRRAGMFTWAEDETVVFFLTSSPDRFQAVLEGRKRQNNKSTKDSQ